MKINKKLLIPVFATAMGLSVVGGVSGAVAWYQYNTKVTASFMGVTTADGGVLQISKDNGSSWDRDAGWGSASSKLHPVTFGALNSNSSLEGLTAKKHPHAGVADMADWEDAVEGTDYYVLSFKLQALKLDNTSHDYVATDAEVSLDSFVLESDSSHAKIGEALRVHIAAGTSNALYAKTAGTIQTNGQLDLDKSGAADVVGGYVWDYSDAPITYGAGTQTSLALTAGSSMFSVPAAGLDVTVTIWLEGWQILQGDSSAIWDSLDGDGATIKFGMTLSTPKSTFGMD